MINSNSNSNSSFSSSFNRNLHPYYKPYSLNYYKIDLDTFYDHVILIHIYSSFYSHDLLTVATTLPHYYLCKLEQEYTIDKKTGLEIFPAMQTQFILQYSGINLPSKSVRKWKGQESIHIFPTSGTVIKIDKDL